MTAPSRQDAATIIEFAAALGPLLKLAETDGRHPRLLTALTAVFKRSLAYAQHGDSVDAHYVLDAEDTLRTLAPGSGAGMPQAVREAVVRAGQVISAVRAAYDPNPADADSLWDAIDRAAAEDCGVTVAEYLAGDDETAERWRTRLPVTVIGVDTDTPTLAGVDHLSVTQLRHIHHDLARLINAKTPPPPEPPTRRAPSRVAAEDAALPLRYTGQQVA